MKQLLAAILASTALHVGLLLGQTPCWSGNTLGPVTTLCSVGIGTATPGNLLHVHAGTNMNFQVGASYAVSGSTLIQTVNDANNGLSPLDIRATDTTFSFGSVGIGSTSAPQRKLDLLDSSSIYQMRFSTGSNEGGVGTDPNGFFRVVGTIGGAFGYGSAAQSTFTEVMRVTSAGVGIGTFDPCANSSAPMNCKLSVAGAIQAQDVTVNTGWSDYVFDPKYRLAPLSEVAGYISEHHHLPDIPSAAEVSEKGVNLGDMQSKLLAKIEELTLHMIQAEKENRELRDRIARLELQHATQNSSR